jgi:hypothetical protein
VLSTPPAFVLSQDQTLQQKPVEKLSRQQNQMLPKESKPTPKKGEDKGIKLLALALQAPC